MSYKGTRQSHDRLRSAVGPRDYRPYMIKYTVPTPGLRFLFVRQDVQHAWVPVSRWKGLTDFTLFHHHLYRHDAGVDGGICIAYVYAYMSTRISPIDYSIETPLSVRTFLGS